MKREFTTTEAEQLRYDKLLFDALTDEEKEDVRIVWDMIDTEMDLINRDFQEAPNYYDLMSMYD